MRSTLHCREREAHCRADSQPSLHQPVEERGRETERREREREREREGERGREREKGREGKREREGERKGERVVTSPIHQLQTHA